MQSKIIRFIGFCIILVCGCFTVHESKAASVERIITAEGFEIWYLRELSVPVISLSIGFRGGSASDPIGKEGLSYFATNLLDEGAGKMDSQSFQKKVTDNAIHLNFIPGRDITSISLRTLSQNRKEAFKLMGLALTQPRFDKEAKERVREQILSKIATGEKQPNSVAIKSWYKAMLGDHPFSRPLEGNTKSILSIQKKDLEDFIRGRFAQDNIFIGASGDVEPEEIASLVDSALKTLPSNSLSFSLPEVKFNLEPHFDVINLDIPQSIAVFGFPGIPRVHKDFYAAYVMNYILGGSGFTSRLYKEVREKRGLAYSVYSYLHTLDSIGLIVGGVATRNDAMSNSIDIIKKELSLMAKNGITKEELSSAKRAITGSFPLKFDTSSSVAQILLSMQFQGLNHDYLERRNSYIENITVTDVRSIAKQLLNQNKMVTVIVGSPKGLTSYK
ncbi:MAG: peptidase M16 [Rhodospirillaceae bacterium]|nr:peptidase M16 [Rhodospirillaceae bacterium]